jgi:pimeloyl-ACP methyl ester carboxylesterase
VKRRAKVLAIQIGEEGGGLNGHIDETHIDDGDVVVGQRRFDPLGPDVLSTALPSGRTVHYIDDGDPGWTTMVWFGGAGTSVRAFRLLEFARSLRQQLQIRVVSLERNGIGQTPFDAAAGVADYAADVWSLLDQLGVDRPSVMAISGGGPYAATVIASRSDRIRSVHLACAFAERPPGAAAPFTVDAIAANPVSWWTYPPDSTVHRIPGFADSAIEEAVRAVFARGRDVPADGLAREFAIAGAMSLPDFSSLDAPSFLYWGSEDRLVGEFHLDRWRESLPGPPLVRWYVGEGHDVQYRHWDQILCDVAHLGARLVVAVDGRTILTSPERAARLLANGATLGLAAWTQGESAPIAEAGKEHDHAARRV